MTLAITGWGVVSSIGIGHEAFSEGVRTQQSGIRPIAGCPVKTPSAMTEAGLVSGFDVAKILGSKKGTRVLDRTAALAVAASAMAIRDAKVTVTPELESQVGVVLGTMNGSIRSSVEYTSETFGTETPYLVSPEAFPNTVMNFAAGQCSIWHRLKALNTTISGGRMACLLALRYGSRMIRCGYAERLVLGSVEEFSEQLAWGAFHSARMRGRAAPPLGEGGAMFVVEELERAREAGRPVRAEITSCEVGFYAGAPRAQRVGLVECIQRTLARASLSPRDVWLVSRRESGMPDLDEPEQQALDEVFGTGPRRISIGKQVGECLSASGSLQLSAILALLESHPEPGRRPVAIMTSLTHGGSVGCAAIRAA